MEAPFFHREDNKRGTRLFHEPASAIIRGLHVVENIRTVKAV